MPDVKDARLGADRGGARASTVTIGEPRNKSPPTQIHPPPARYPGGNSIATDRGFIARGYARTRPFTCITGWSTSLHQRTVPPLVSADLRPAGERSHTAPSPTSVSQSRTAHYRRRRLHVPQPGPDTDELAAIVKTLGPA